MLFSDLGQLALRLFLCDNFSELTLNDLPADEIDVKDVEVDMDGGVVVVVDS
jgi:hypothetical protein